jgi:zinc/manganese transport system permease protein
MKFLAAGVPPFTLNLWQDLHQIWQYDFMQRAIIAGTILSLIAGLVGTFVVVRHQAFAGESLSDVAFTGALGGAALGFNPLLTLFGTTVLVALIMGGFGERLRGRDVAIGTVLAWVLGLGDLFLVLFTSHVSGTGTGFSGVTILFGNLLGTSPDAIGIIAWVGAGVLVALFVIARPLLFASLDPDVAAARGVAVRSIGLGFMVILAVTVSLATLTVGALLVFALLLLPAAIAQQMTTRPYVALMLAAGIALVVTWVGIAFSFYTSYPVSVSISLLAFTVYLVTLGRNALNRRASASPRSPGTSGSASLRVRSSRVPYRG